MSLEDGLCDDCGKKFTWVKCPYTKGGKSVHLYQCPQEGSR